MASSTVVGPGGWADRHFVIKNGALYYRFTCQVKLVTGRAALIVKEEVPS